MMCQ
jgi:putative tryptophan/tyrosine transport system substrate-binding protein